MSEERPAIPEPIKREVRQQCYFGCAICGMPFFQYDHIEEYAEVKEHTADNLILLCPNHHSAKTTRKLSKERIREAKSNPFNAINPRTSGFKVEPSKELIVRLGSNTATGWYPNGNGDYHPIWINGKSFFTIHSNEGWLTISITITNNFGNVLLEIDKGELMISTTAWDYVYEGDNIKVRAGLGDILLDLNLSDSKVEVLKGMFFDNNIDGFVVENGALLRFVQGRNRGSFTGCQVISHGFGGWGLLNSKTFPNIHAPIGFGSFQKC